MFLGSSHRRSASFWSFQSRHGSRARWLLCEEATNVDAVQYRCLLRMNSHFRVPVDDTQSIEQTKDPGIPGRFSSTKRCGLFRNTNACICGHVVGRNRRMPGRAERARRHT